MRFHRASEKRKDSTQLETGPDKDHQSTGMLIHVACQQNQSVRQGVLEFGIRLRGLFARGLCSLPVGRG